MRKHLKRIPANNPLTGFVFFQLPENTRDSIRDCNNKRDKFK